MYSKILKSKTNLTKQTQKNIQNRCNINDHNDNSTHDRPHKISQTNTTAPGPPHVPSANHVRATKHGYLICILLSTVQGARRKLKRKAMKISV